MKKSTTFLLSIALATGMPLVTIPQAHAIPAGCIKGGTDGGATGKGFGVYDCSGQNRQVYEAEDIEDTAIQPMPQPTLTPEEYEKILKENYDSYRFPDGSDTYYLAKDRNSCITSDGKAGKVDYSVNVTETGFVGTVPGHPYTGNPICVETEVKPGEETDPILRKRQEQLAEIQRKFEEMTPAKPYLRLNNHPEPHVWIDDNTHFYVELEGSNTFDGELNAGHVQIRAVPVQYNIEAGNGTSYTTQDPGVKVELAPGKDMPKTVTSYRYKDSGNYHAYVTVTYTGQYKIGDGPWIPLEGTNTRLSDPTLVRVWETEVHSVAKTCTEDPAAWGCPQHPDYADFNNPNPRLRTPDPHTGQKWHQDNEGKGDTGRYGFKNKKKR